MMHDFYNTLTLEEHNRFMDITLQLAKTSGNDIPVAALIIRNKQILSSSTNKKEAYQDPTAHAEILAIKDASQKLKTWRLDNVVMYTTLEPCPMCAAAIMYSRIPLIVFGAYDPLYGAFGSVLDLSMLNNFHPPKIIGGIRKEAAAELIQSFFMAKRTQDA
jgi:tRNA(adenine34) deaminase